MTDFFVRPWEISDSGNSQSLIEVDGEYKTFEQLRKRLYENIIDELLFIARASEGAVPVEWTMNQPIFIRKKYVEEFKAELKEREAKLNSANK